MDVRVQPEPFDPGAEANAFTARVEGAGAVVTFSGLSGTRVERFRE